MELNGGVSYSPAASDADDVSDGESGAAPD